MSFSFHWLQRSTSRIRVLSYYYQHDISLHTSRYTIHLSLSPCENNSPKGRLIYRTSSVRSVTFISMSHSPQGIWTTPESITTMQIQAPLTIQIMIRWSSDFINTLAYTVYHMSCARVIKSNLWSMWLCIYMDRLQIQISLPSVFNLWLLVQHSKNGYR